VNPFESDPSLNKLLRLLGPEKGAALIREIMRQLGLTEIRTPDDRLRFGGALIERGGLYEAVGRAIRVQAILHGATGS
jgi:hypothetical protein